MTPHLIRKVFSRDGTVLEEADNSSSKVTSEYVALTMVQMMRGVTSGGGTASNASAGGLPVAGKTGTVNDHTDVWFIGYTPTYATGVWMGNPLKKENLGNSWTGHAAVPLFNDFMNPFMKGKPRETFPGPPPVPTDIKALIARSKREELEALDEADQAGKKTGVTFDSGPKPTPDPAFVTGDQGNGINTTKPDNNKPSGDDDPKIKPAATPAPKKPENPPAEKPEGTKRKGRKGDGR
ncbi:MAG: penicillin-binding transpeptidase domain-containing protein, partial [Acidobacteriota bacterium]